MEIQEMMNTQAPPVEKIYIADLEKDQHIITYFMVKRIEVKKGSNGKNYLDVLLGDKTGDISGKKWNLADEEIEGARQYEVGSVVKVKAVVTEWNGMKQLTIKQLRMTNKEDGIVLTDYIKAAPEPPEEMLAYITGTIEEMADEDLKKLCNVVIDSFHDKLMYYPAASKNHHAEKSGLLWHMKRMLMSGKALCGVYTSLDKDLVLAGVILHDMQKINEIKSDEMGISDGYYFEGMMLGHLVQGVKELEKVMLELDFPYEKKVMVEHMILSHHYEPEFGSPKRPLFPEAELLHYLDVIDAKMYDMEEALLATKPGGFSDKVWTLNNRKIYKREDNK